VWRSARARRGAPQRRSKEIIWTSGATEGNNLAIKGAANFYKGKGKHIVTMKTEHKAVLDTVRELERQGFEATYLDPRQDGLLDLEKFKAALRPDTVLVSVMMVNNEIGVIQPIARSARSAARRASSSTATRCRRREDPGRSAEAEGGSSDGDRAQGVRPERHRRSVRRRKPRVRIEPHDPRRRPRAGLRSGTLPTHQIVGMGEAFRIARLEMGAESERIRALRDRLLAGFKDMEEVYVNGDMERRIPETSTSASTSSKASP